MKPPVAPVALDYLAGAVRGAGYEPEILDLAFASDVSAEVARRLSRAETRLVAVTFRNSDDCFWPSATSFVPQLVGMLRDVRSATDAPVVLGGSGFSLFPEAILHLCDAEFGVQGDGEAALPSLLKALDGGGDLARVPGLVHRRTSADGAAWVRNPRPPAARLSLDPGRDFVDNARYFREGGQIGVETKRGCDRACTYCADPLIKGPTVRTRKPGEVADEVEALLAQGVDVLHLCDSEFNIPLDHAFAVCDELAGRGAGERVKWYTYASVVPFPGGLARAMRRAGCVGVNFGADSASERMLATYGRRHRRADIEGAAAACRASGLRVMIDLLLGGPGETPATVRETIDAIKSIGPDCAGAALGVRIYPGTRIADQVMRGGPLVDNPNLRRREGDRPAQAMGRERERRFLQPVFYISQALGEEPAQLVRDVIGGDQRFFEPVSEQSAENYNYNDNQPLIEAIRGGARGAYWDILRQLRG
ncbi:MAG: radical SAM protein [Candidatus Brocadiaceae bacterium]